MWLQIFALIFPIYFVLLAKTHSADILKLQVCAYFLEKNNKIKNCFEIFFEILKKIYKKFIKYSIILMSLLIF